MLKRGQLKSTFGYEMLVFIISLGNSFIAVLTEHDKTLVFLPDVHNNVSEEVSLAQMKVA